jgi:hypothetical protein
VIRHPVVKGCSAYPVPGWQLFNTVMMKVAVWEEYQPAVKDGAGIKMEMYFAGILFASEFSTLFCFK